MEHTHEWVGTAQGVTCKYCKKFLTAEEFAKFLKPKEQKKPSRKKVEK